MIYQPTLAKVTKVLVGPLVFVFSDDSLCLVRKLRNEPKIGHKGEINDLL